jgi:hypothetical protein
MCTTMPTPPLNILIKMRQDNMYKALDPIEMLHAYFKEEI